MLRDIDTGKELKGGKAQVDLSWFPQRTAMALRRQRITPEQALQVAHIRRLFLYMFVYIYIYIYIHIYIYIYRYIDIDINI